MPINQLSLSVGRLGLNERGRELSYDRGACQESKSETTLTVEEEETDQTRRRRPATSSAGWVGPRRQTSVSMQNSVIDEIIIGQRLRGGIFTVVVAVRSTDA